MKSGVSLLALFILLRGSDSTLLKLLQRAGEATHASGRPEAISFCSKFFVSGSTDQQLWKLGLVSRLLADGSLGARRTGLLAVIQTPEAMQGYLRRAQSQDDA